MKALPALAAIGLSLMSLMGTVSAQPYGGRDYYGDRDYGPRDRDYGPRGRDYEYERGGRPYGGGRGDYAFDEQEYLRCNPDVRRAVVNGQMASGLAHYRTFGRREGRRLSC